MTNPTEFLQTFCHACIDAGADAILGHGPHELHGIELYQSKPVFCSLGNFIFQSDTVRYQPAAAYEAVGQPHDAQIGEYMDRRSQNDTKDYAVQQSIWRSVMAGFTAKGGRIEEIALYPISLHMELPRCRRGFPTLSRDEETLASLAKLSEPFGTNLKIADGVGHIRCIAD